MPRRPNIVPAVKIHYYIDSDVWTMMTLHLYSPLEKKVPYGAYSKFISDLIRDYFSKRPEPENADRTIA